MYYLMGIMSHCGLRAYSPHACLSVRGTRMISPGQGFSSLVNAQSRDISTLSEQIDELDAIVAKYDTVVKTLETVDEKVNHDVMIPLGKFALIPGKLIHTNEVYVHLGADMFALRSSKQAIELANLRRTKFLQKSEKLKDARKLSSDWKSTAEDLSSEFISMPDKTHEHVTEEEYVRWKENRSKKPVSQEVLEKKEKARKAEDDEVHKRLMERLDELERLEELEDEEFIQKPPAVASKKPAVSLPHKEEFPPRSNFRLSFTNSVQSEPPKRSESDRIDSPADIPSCGPVRKSSLKQKQVKTASRARVCFGESVDVKTIDNIARRPAAEIANLYARPMAEQPVVIDSPSPAVSSRESPQSGGNDEPDAPRVSRFKAARIKAKSSN
ncbi:unnamed protein product [Notodromas monacha]|uniref:Uncharacterized protein n=1 Tax=Notodromas monacha TaxID=399045 RepID=A0A7R9BG99_9CRUS|nr:unnamed protein product [Notodromas monacha]CAG0914923.1 unnamed protein product [Notodromas monacha]